jgi:hypothetical protein
MIKLICEVCEKEFFRSTSEVNRNKKIGRRVFCSRECQGKVNLSNLGEKRVHEHLTPWRTCDEFSPFRKFLSSAKGSCKHRNKSKKKKDRIVSITLEDLKSQWEKQKGICPYTGWQLKISEKTTNGTCLSTTPDRASLDRIDSSKGYTKDNIQFVALIAQYAKNGWAGQEVLKFCRAVVENNAFGA